MNTNNEILERIRELADLKKLEKNCEVELDWAGKCYIFDYCDNQEDGEEIRVLISNSIQTLDRHDISKLKIIGLPVHLEHLLLAIEKTRQVGFDVQFLRNGTLFFNPDIEYSGADYNLSLTVEQNLNENEELKKLVGGLLG